MKITNDRQYILKERQILFFLVTILTITLISILAIDLYGLFGIRDRLFQSTLDMPYFWFHWYRNGGPIEFIQYSFLGLSAVYAAKNSLLSETMNEKKFWSIFAIALIYLLIEDAGDPRHFIRFYVQRIAGETEQGFWGTIVEMTYFAALASIPVYAYLRYGGKALKNHFVTKKYMLGGFVFYALAAGSSFVGSAFSALLDRNIYRIMGERMINILILIGDSEVATRYLGRDYSRISYYLMDSPYEESLELIGGALFLMAALSFVNRNKSSELIEQ